MEVTISIDDKIFVNIFIITRKDKCKMKSSTFPYLSVKNFINEEKQHFCHEFSIFISITHPKQINVDVILMFAGVMFQAENSILIWRQCFEHL